MRRITVSLAAACRIQVLIEKLIEKTPTPELMTNPPRRSQDTSRTATRRPSLRRADPTASKGTVVTAHDPRTTQDSRLRDGTAVAPSVKPMFPPPPEAARGGDMVPFRTAVRAWAGISLQTFSGPAEQIAVMQRTLVDDRRWIGQHRFLHALSYCTLLPGPEAQQLAIYVGWVAQRCPRRPGRRHAVRPAGRGGPARPLGRLRRRRRLHACLSGVRRSGPGSPRDRGARRRPGRQDGPGPPCATRSGRGRVRRPRRVHRPIPGGDRGRCRHRMGPGPMVPFADVLARFGHALSDPTRTRVLLALRKAPAIPPISPS